MSQNKTRLFLSHASEQKEEIVDHLVSALSETYEVWYDKERSRAGASLLSSISDGLNWCDYAVIIISPEFIKKEWTKAELRGAWTLQIERKRSVVIPIWFGVSRQDVIELSPILADLAAIVSKDFKTILNGIRLAVGTGEQARDRLSPLGRKFRQFQEIVGPLEKYKQWSVSAEGFNAIHTEWEQIEALANDLLEQHAESRFKVASGSAYGGMTRYVQVKGFQFLLEPDSLQSRRILNLQFDLVGNIIPSMICRRQIYFDPISVFAGRIPPEIADELTFFPFCTAEGRAVWREKGMAPFDTTSLVEVGLQRLLDIASQIAIGEIPKHWSSFSKASLS